MKITRMNYRLFLLIPLLFLSSCKRKEYANWHEELDAKSKRQLVGGSVLSAVAIGTATATSVAFAAGSNGVFVGAIIGSVGVVIGSALLAVCVIGPIALITGPIAAVLLVKGVKNRREAKRLEDIKISRQIRNRLREGSRQEGHREVERLLDYDLSTNIDTEAA